MKIQVPPSLVKAADSPHLVEAVYFVVRVLGNSLRGYHNTVVSTEPSPQARRLAEKAVKEIEAAEKCPTDMTENARLEKYISKLEAFLRDKTAPTSSSLVNDAKRVLRQMRAQRT